MWNAQAVQRLLPIPAWHRAYVRSHPIGLAVALGIFLGGLIGLLAPGAVRGSAPTLILPEWVLVFFNVVWVLGGGLSTLGLIRGLREVEIPGMMLTAGGLGAYYITAVSLRSTSALTALFIALLSFGCAGRAWNLYRYGYDGRLT